MTLEGGVPRGALSSVWRVRSDPPAVRYVLPMPGTSPPLSLNDRGRNPHAKARKVRTVREAVAWRAIEARIPVDVPRIIVELFYVPRDRRTRDADNLVATLKPCIDALTARGRARGWPCHPVVADDDPAHVTWLPPVILEPDARRARWWLEVTIPDGPGGDLGPATHSDLGRPSHVVQG